MVVVDACWIVNRAVLVVVRHVMLSLFGACCLLMFVVIGCYRVDAFMPFVCDRV